MTTTETATPTRLASLAERAHAVDWWKEDAKPAAPELVLPTRLLKALEDAGIETVEQLKAAGPERLKSLDHIGKLGFEMIVAMLRALDRENGNGAAES